MPYSGERESILEIPKPEFDFSRLPPEVRMWARQNFEIGRITEEQARDPDILRDLHEDYVTAAHEIGHKRVAEALGWKVKKTTIVPDGAARGMTIAEPPEGRPVTQLIPEKIAICYGGFYGEQGVGHTDHRGCGSDMAHAAFLNEQMRRFSRAEQLSAASHVHQIALGAIGSYDLEREAWKLTKEKVMMN